MRTVGAILVGSGILLMFVGVIVGFFVAPIGFIAIGLGAIDLLIARQFTENRRGSVIIPGAEAEADPDAIAAQEPPPGMPGENPYARED
jgi:hypothetical protein